MAQDVIVRAEDCDIENINLQMIRAQKAEDTFDALEILQDQLLGRVVAAQITDEHGAELIAKDTVLTEEDLERIGVMGVGELVLRGNSLTGNHTVQETIILGKNERVVEQFIAEYKGKELVMPYSAPLTAELLMSLLNDDSVATISVRMNNIRGIEVEAIRESSSSQRGVIEPLRDRILGRVLAEDIFDINGEVIATKNTAVDETLAKRICSVRDKVMIRSVLTCKCAQGVCKKCYGQDLANQSEVEVGEAVGIIAAQSIGEPGTQLTMRTFHTGGVAGGDITQGLPRVEELFEARKPKMSAIISEISGYVSYGQDDKSKLRTVIITPTDKQNQLAREYVIPFGVPPRVKEGEYISSGTSLTDGPKNPHDILRISGLKETHRYLVKEVQKVYKSQGVEINDKHIEVMVRQMLHKVRAGGVYGGFSDDDGDGHLYY